MWILATTLLALLAGCAPTVDRFRAVEPDDPFDVGIGDQVLVEEFQLRITFRGVPDDSRCPVGAQCVHAGDAAVELALFRDGRERVVTLHTSERAGPRWVDLDGRRLTLLGLEPAPRTDRSIADDYRATLRLAGG